MWQIYDESETPAAVLLRRPYMAVCEKSRGAWRWFIRDLRLALEADVVERGRGTYTRIGSVRAAAETALATRPDVARQDY